MAQQISTLTCLGNNFASLYLIFGKILCFFIPLHENLGKLSVLSFPKEFLALGKNDTSNAETHAHDIRELFDSNEVANKPILLMETDGATVIIQKTKLQTFG